VQVKNIWIPYGE